MMDASRILAVLEAVYDQSPWTLEQIEADLGKPESQYFYAYDQQDLVGFLSLQLLAGEVEITNIAVKPSHQGRGLADQLMGHVQEIASPIFLEVRTSNLPAQKLYAKHGFTAVGKRKNYYHNPAEDAVIMVREGS